MNKIFTYLFLGILLISLVSSLEFDNIKSSPDVSKGYYEIGTKTIPYKDIWETYQPIEIKNWFGLGDVLFKGAITEHTPICSDNCNSQMVIQTTSKGRLIEDVKFYTIRGDNKIEQSINNYSFYINIGDKELEWKLLDITQEYEAGTYMIELKADKKINRVVDWVIKTQGETLNEWATWGVNGTIKVDSLGTLKDVTLSIPNINLNTTNSSSNGRANTTFAFNKAGSFKVDIVETYGDLSGGQCINGTTDCNIVYTLDDGYNAKDIKDEDTIAIPLSTKVKVIWANISCVAYSCPQTRDIVIKLYQVS